MRTLEKARRLITGAGSVSATHEVTVDPFSPGTETRALALEDCPPILSLGKLCLESGFSFNWLTGQPPSLTFPDGRTIVLNVEGRVPVWPVNGKPVLACSADGEPDASPGARGSSDPPATDPHPADGDDGELTTTERGVTKLSPEHFLTHEPKHHDCEVCRRAKLIGRPCRRKTDENRSADSDVAAAKKFGDLITIDYMSSRSADTIDQLSSALIMKDIGTGWIDVFPASSHHVDETVEALQTMVGPRDKVRSIYSDDAPEFKAAVRVLGWRLSTSTPGKPQSNGIAERAVRSVVDGARTLLEQSGLPIRWWSRAARFFCLMKNCTGLSPTPWEKRHEAPFPGRLVPFGSVVFYRSAIDPAGRFEPTGQKGIVVGYHMNAGSKWSGDIYVLDYKTMVDNCESKFVKSRRVGEFTTPDGPPLFPLYGRAGHTERISPLGASAPTGESLDDVSPKTPPGLSLEKPGDGEDLGAHVPTPATGLGGGSESDPTAAAAVPSEPRTKRYAAGEWIDHSVFDASLLQKGYELGPGGRITRKMKSAKPPHIHSDLWQSMSPKARAEASSAYRASLVPPTSASEPRGIHPDAKAALTKLCPIMPRSDSSDDTQDPHREKLDEGPLHGLSLVARPVPPKEVRTNTQAQAAMDKEWKALWDMATWDAKGVSEWSAVKQDAVRKGERVHVGMVFGWDLCGKGRRAPARRPGPEV